MALLADLLSTVFERRFRRENSDLVADSRPLKDLAMELVNSVGETCALDLAEGLLSRFSQMDDVGKLSFFRFIATGMDIDPDAVRKALLQYESNPSKASYRAFSDAAEPRRQELIRRLNQVPGATAALVAMRADLMRLGAKEPELAALDLDFRHLFVSWFNRGFLVLRPISWESPAHILEKIIAYEAVHAIDSWSDLRRRLEPADRRCFAFFHPSMPDDPLIFVEVALTRGAPGSVQALLAQEREVLPASKADTAVFYSISNCQAGLAGVSFGNSLIKQVTADLSAELPRLKSFVTLSPIPGLTLWLSRESVTWTPENPEEMKALAAHYLMNAKTDTGLPLDPVARFHLSNGAVLHAVHGDADTSEKGRRQSGCTMVNYLYELERIAQNQQKFATTRTVVASPNVQALAQTAQLSSPDER